MKKIGIITLNGYDNYGNRLQNYALQEVLKSFNFSAETILINNSEILKGQNTSKKRLKIILYRLKKLLTKNKRHEKLHKEKIEKFEKFTHKYINETNYAISESNLYEQQLKDFDYFITGSDQVWNPYYNFMSFIYFLGFADKSKRIAYAPSIGVSQIPAKSEERYTEWLNDIKSLSVREVEGSNLIKKLTGREAEILVDPTMLLTKEKWLSISSKAKPKPSKNYLLTYFLGGVPKYYQEQINRIADEKGLDIINLGDIDEGETYTADPSEYLDYIHSCSILCTDSFHGSVFAILFEKPFIVFERKGKDKPMNSRISTLLNTFKFQDRLSSRIQTSSEAFNINFSHVPNILEVERTKAFEFFEKSLNI